MSSQISSSDKMSEWFSTLIATIRTDQLMLETNVANQDKVKMYNTFINGSEADMFQLGRMTTSTYFIKELLNTYLKEVITSGAKLNKLAFVLSDSKILAWAVVNDDDDESIDKLLISEAKTNAIGYKYGFHISTTVVENCDNLNVPKHYNFFDLTQGNWQHSKNI